MAVRKTMVMALLLALTLIGPATAQGVDAPLQLRLGLVKFGAINWIIDTARYHRFDRDAGIDIATTDLANPAAGEVALQAGAVNAIFSDWLWVSRQRNAGQKITFVPRSTALGEVLTAPGSPINSPADLPGHRLGIVGGPVEKSWLLLRAYGQQVLGRDLAQSVEPVYGAPPLLSEELKAGRIDAVLTFWPYAARLSAAGYRTVISMTQVMAGLGISPPVPLTGFAVTEAWIAGHPGGVERFLAAEAEAERMLAGNDDEWRRLRPLTGAENDAVLTALRDRFRAGQIVGHAEPAIDAPAERLFGILAASGGGALTGGATRIAPGTFWAGAKADMGAVR